MDEKDFERAVSVLQREFSDFGYKRDIQYTVGGIRIHVYNFEGEYEISLRKYPSHPKIISHKRLDKKISKILSKTLPILGSSYFHDDYNDAAKWHLWYVNPNNLDLKIHRFKN